MKRIYLLLGFVFSLFSLNAQSFLDIKPFDQCGANNYVNEMETIYPGFTEAVNKTLLQAKERGELNRGGGDVYTVKVVIHIVYKDDKPAENLDDSIILDQMRVLNEDYRRTNADSGNLRSIYDGLAGDAKINFVLDRIIRVSTTKKFKAGLTSLASLDAAKQTSKGGSDAVDPTHYLNIWVVNIQPIMIGPIVAGLLLGYAYPPADLANWPPGNSAPAPGLDGVLIDYRAFGSNNPNKYPSPYDALFDIKGRTPVHEVGHYLGLRHIWADKSDPIFGTPNCNGEDDGADDTPFCGSNSQLEGCDPTKNTCNKNQPGDLPDMWENYMDYSRENCQNTFTNDQIAIMRAVLEGPRAELLSPTTGIHNNIQAEKGIIVYPNPAKNQVHFDAKEVPVTLEVFDVMGKKLYNSTHNELRNTIDLTGKTGVYFIKGGFKDGSFSQKVILN